MSDQQITLSNRGTNSIGHGGTRPPLLQTAGHRGHHDCRKTANKKQTKL